MTLNQRKALTLFFNRVREMRKLQAAAQFAKTQGGGSIEARDKWNQSIHFSRLVDATLPEVLSIVSSFNPELYDSSERT